MKKTITMAAIMVAASLITACHEENKEAKQLLVEIRANCDAGHYQEALLGIDSLRHTYPEAIEERKEALKLHQEASLKQAQENLAHVDSVLQSVQGKYDALKPEIDRKHADGSATEQELRHFNELRKYRDSLQTVFNVECSKIKYIHKRQKE